MYIYANIHCVNMRETSKQSSVFWEGCNITWMTTSLVIQ